MTYIPGKTITNIANTAISSQSIVAAGSITVDVTVVGAIMGRHVVIPAPLTDPGTLVIACAWVIGANKVRLRITNLSALSVTISATTWYMALTPIS